MNLDLRMLASCSWPVVCLVCVGCVCTSRTTPSPPAAQNEIRLRLNQIIDAAETKDLDRLDSYHWYGPQFTKYASSSAARQDAAAARKGEHDGLSSISHLKMHVEDLKMDVLGDVAIATFLLRANFEAGGKALEKQDRSTLVFVQRDGSWKIVHEHLSAVPATP